MLKQESQPHTAALEAAALSGPKATTVPKTFGQSRLTPVTVLDGVTVSSDGFFVRISSQLGEDIREGRAVSATARPTKKEEVRKGETEVRDSRKQQEKGETKERRSWKRRFKGR